jgi:hypothetical protein
VTESCNGTLRLHRPTSNSSSTTNFPWLSPTELRLLLLLLLSCRTLLVTIFYGPCTENTCHVFATQPVHRRAGRCLATVSAGTYRNYVTWPLPTVVWHHRGNKENTVPVLLAACVLRALPSNRFTCHYIHIYMVLRGCDFRQYLPTRQPDHVTPMLSDISYGLDSELLAKVTEGKLGGSYCPLVFYSSHCKRGDSSEVQGPFPPLAYLEVTEVEFGVHTLRQILWRRQLDHRRDGFAPVPLCFNGKKYSEAVISVPQGPKCC